MIECNQKIFLSLIEFAQKKGEIIENDKKVRFITTNDEEKEIIKRFKIGKKEKITQKIEFSLGFFKEDNYLIIIGPNTDELTEDLLNFGPNEINAGWFTIIVNLMNIEIKVDSSIYEIKDRLDNRYLNHQSQSSYPGHDFLEISTFFKSIHVFKINTRTSDQNLYRNAGLFLCSSVKLLNLNIDRKLLEIYKDTFLEISNNLPYERILDSLISMRWKDSFLDTYRCIERLFSYIHVNNLYKDLSLTLNIHDFIKKIEDHLKWKPKENIAIDLIFSTCTEPEKDFFLAVRKKIDGKTEPHDIGTKLIYCLRNSIVHDRTNDDKTYEILDEKDWTDLVCGMLLVIKRNYKDY